MVVRHQTRHWQDHDGQCLCQTGQETVEHVFWQCPRYAKHRWGAARCSQAAGAQRPLCQRVLGTPLVLQELAVWRAAFRPFVLAKPQWMASEIYADGSGRNPKDPQVRVVGWAFCARLHGRWVSAAGLLEPVATVTAGEATAVARAVELLMVGGLVVTDCQAVWKMWHRIRRNPRAVSRGVSHPCWLLLAEALDRHPTARCEWMRSHRTAAEAQEAGYPAAWHEGNAQADTAAKEVALARDVPGAVLAAYRRHKEAAEQVAGTVAAIQLFRLQARPRSSAARPRRKVCTICGR
jgi:ribonuclease HI